VKRVTLFVVCLLVAATVSHAAVEMIISRVEEGGRLLVPVRGVFELTGASVEWDAASSGVHIVGGGNDIWMWVNNQGAVVNGADAWLDVPPRNISGRVHIPLRFVGESLGRSVNYADAVVTLSAPYEEDIVLYVDSMQYGGGGGGNRGEILPQSDDRALTNGDLAGMSNWRLTLARNEIYARHGRPFSNDHIRAYFQSTGWYRVRSGFAESWLSQTESRNAAFIADYQRRVFGTPATRP